MKHVLISTIWKGMVLCFLVMGWTLVQTACRGGVEPTEKSSKDGGTGNTNNTNTNQGNDAGDSKEGSSNNNTNNTNNQNNPPDNSKPKDENKPPQKVTIQDIQDASSPNHVGKGGGVILKGVIATTPLFRVNDTLNGFFIGDTFPAKHGGVMVVIGKDDLKTLKIGDVLDVEGAVDEYFGNTQVSAQASRGGIVTNTGSNRESDIKAVEVKAEDLPADPTDKGNPDASKPEPYEGMLVELKNVTVETEADQYGAWTLQGGVLVEDTFFRYKPKKGDKIGFVRGVLQYTFDKYRLLPRTYKDIDGAKPECDASTACGAGQKCLVDIGTCEYIVCTADTDCNQGEMCKKDTSRCEKPTATVTIQQIQDPTAQGRINAGDPVELKGVIAVTQLYSVSANLQGFFVADPDKPGKYGGVLVVVGKDWKETIAVGDEVNLNGKVQEYFGGTQIAVTTTQGEKITKTGTNKKDAIKPTVVTVDDLPSTPADKNKPDDSKAEPYEGVFVELKNVTVDDAPNNFGEWTLDGGKVLVDDTLFKYAATKGEKISVLRGVILYSFDKFRLLPRSAEDIVK